MKKIIFLFILMCGVLFCSCEKKAEEVSGFSMDAPYSIKADDLSDEEKKEAGSIISKCDILFDAYDESSAISILNKEKKLAGNEEVYEVIKNSLLYCDESFDITIRNVSKLWNFNSDNPVPPSDKEIKNALKSVDYKNVVADNGEITLLNNTEIELGGVVKGYCADRVFEALKESEAVIDIGGTVITSKKDGITVGVREPFGDGILCSLKLPYGYGISTSGTYERSFYYNDKFYHHILNPKTGMSVENNLLSVSVISKSAFLSDILSTKYFVEGLEGDTEDDVGVIYVTKDKKIYTKGNINFDNINNSYEVAYAY